VFFYDSNTTDFGPFKHATFFHQYISVIKESLTTPLPQLCHNPIPHQPETSAPHPLVKMILQPIHTLLLPTCSLADFLLAPTIFHKDAYNDNTPICGAFAKARLQLFVRQLAFSLDSRKNAIHKFS
jgi:hypothetical protein